MNYIKQTDTNTNIYTEEQTCDIEPQYVPSLSCKVQHSTTGLDGHQGLRFQNMSQYKLH